MARSRTVSMPFPVKNMTERCLCCRRKVRLGHEHSEVNGHSICSPECYANVKAADDETAALCCEPTFIRFEYFKNGQRNAA